MTSYSIGAHASAKDSFIEVSGKFSYDYISIKSHMYNDNSVATRVQVKHKLYTVLLQPDAPLHPNFKSRIFDIAANLQINNTRIAHYLADTLVRDFGTHYLTAMDAGAILAQIDFIDRSYVEEGSANKTSIAASASASFFGKVSLGADFTDENSHPQLNSFISSRTYSKVVALGGPPFNVNSTLEEWETGIPDALVAIDRYGNQLHLAINPNTLPELCEETSQLVSDIVYEAISRYFQANTILGCTNMNVTNFNFQANVDDGSCSDDPETVNYSFGGVSLNCSGNLSTSECMRIDCPENFLPLVKIHSFTIGTIHYDAYWCSVKPNADDFLLFGGFYTTTKPNPITGVIGCPNYFYPQHWILGPGVDVFICVSRDKEHGSNYSAAFGGFESCETAIPIRFRQLSINILLMNGHIAAQLATLNIQLHLIMDAGSMCAWSSIQQTASKHYYHRFIITQTLLQVKHWLRPSLELMV